MLWTHGSDAIVESATVWLLVFELSRGSSGTETDFPSQSNVKIWNTSPENASGR